MALTYEILGSEDLTPVLIVVMVNTVVMPEILIYEMFVENVCDSHCQLPAQSWFCIKKIIWSINIPMTLRLFLAKTSSCQIFSSSSSFGSDWYKYKEQQCVRRIIKLETIFCLVYYITTWGAFSKYLFFVQVFEMGHVLCMYGLLKAIIVKIGKYFALLENDVQYNSTTIIWEVLKKT